MTGFEIYEIVVAHLKSMSRRSYNESTKSCAYRTLNGNKCAVGCLIPDELYDPSMEGLSIDSIWSEGTFVGDALAHLRPHSELLDQLQCFHDDEGNWTSKGLHKSSLKHLESIKDFIDE